jgi:TonB-dependent starch-binding outer membrane protein SusC
MKNKILPLLLTFVCAASVAFAQKITVLGKVTDGQTKEPIVGASVLERGTTNGVVADIDGKFELQMMKGATLVVSFVGMVAVEKVIDKSSTVEIVLESAASELNQVVVVGYGTQRKKDIAGAVSSVGVERLDKRNSFKTAEESLQGEIAGVQVTSPARPGDAAEIVIRGYNTTSGNNRPLILVDGIETGRLFTVDPNDIESITVLKDAASAAIYGYRAANGVILITSKKGKKGKQALSYSAYFGQQEVTHKIPMLNAEQYVTLLNEATKNANAAPFYDDADVAKYKGQQGTYWQDALLRKGFMQNHYLNSQGSSEKSVYAISLGFTGQEGIYLNTNFNRYNGKVSSEHTFGKLKIGQNLSFSYTHQNTGGDYYISRVFLMAPTVPVRFDDGSYGFDSKDAGNGDKKNPVAMSELIKWTNEQTEVFGNVYGELELMKGLTLRTTFAFDRRIEEKNYYEPSYRLGNVNQQSFADVADFKDWTYDFDTYLTYKKLFAKKHSLTATLGTWARKHRNNFILAKGFNFPSKYVNQLNYVSADNRVINGNFTEYKMNSYFGRFDYGYDEKYYVSATVRRDGSSRFAPAQRWGTFPSVGLAWRASNEKFFTPLSKIVSDLKFRASWGQLGNSVIGDYEWQSLVNLGLNYSFGGAVAQGGAPVNLANSDIHWETTEQVNVGADLGLFKDKVSFKVDYFDKKTSGILINIPVPLATGANNAPRQNIGVISNKGWEFEARVSQNIKDFNFSVGGNIAFVSNKIEDFNGISYTTGREGYSNIYQEGYGMRTLWGYKTDGIFQNKAQLDARPHWAGAAPGDLIFVDTNGDGKITAADRTTLGSGIPKATYGLNLNANYKGFDFSMLFQGVFGNKITLADANFGGGRGFFNFLENLIAVRADRWHGEGTSTTQPRLYYRGDPGHNNDNTDFFVEDGSYTRLKNLQIGYTLPAKLMKKLNIQRFRVYVGGTNLVTWTKYTGFDPEIALNGNDSYGWDYPMAKTVIVGVNLDF